MNILSIYFKPERNTEFNLIMENEENFHKICTFYVLEYLF